MLYNLGTSSAFVIPFVALFALKTVGQKCRDITVVMKNSYNINKISLYHIEHRVRKVPHGAKSQVYIWIKMLVF
jgi:hypothetical protein